MSRAPGFLPSSSSRPEGPKDAGEQRRVGHLAQELGRFRLLNQLGNGRMGISHLAVPREVERRGPVFVIRAMRPKLIDDAALVRLFVDQTTLAGGLLHGCIVRTFEGGIQNRRPFEVMEHVDGLSLQRLIDRARVSGLQIPLALLVHVTLDVLAGLEFAHSIGSSGGAEHGVFHGELSPRKILISRRGQIKIMDFAAANANSEASPTARDFTGALQYTAPELVAGGRADWRADLFSVGVLLWQGAVGRLPWDGQPASKVLESLQSGRIPRLFQVAPHVDPTLAAIIERAMAPAPDWRFPTARAMRERLEIYATELSLGGGAGRRPPDRSTARELLAKLVSELCADEPTTPIPPHGPVVSVIASLGQPPALPLAWWPRAKRGTGKLGTAALLALAGGGLGLCSRPLPKSPPSLVGRARATVSLPSGSAAQPMPSTPSFVARPPSLARVAVRVSPLNARVFLDDHPIANPFVAVQRRDTSTHRLHAEASGYNARTIDLSFQADAEVEIELSPQSWLVHRLGPMAWTAPQATQAQRNSKTASGASSPGTLGIDNMNPYQQLKY